MYQNRSTLLFLLQFVGSLFCLTVAVIAVALRKVKLNARLTHRPV